MPELSTAPTTTVTSTTKLLTLDFEGVEAGDVASLFGGPGVDLITEAGATNLEPSTHSGRNRLILAAGDLTLDNAEGYSAGEIFNVYATATIDILVSGVTLTPPAGGSEQMTAGMAISIVMTAPTTAIMFGQTVASS